ncbi:MAG: hypothetical protein EOM52_10430 [Clostridia bacterium]|nr:hypothetical protein [Clostridia bacterium]
MKTAARAVLGYPITASVLYAGDDLCMTILGGCTPHVGSVSVARWEGGAVRVESLIGPGHKDYVVGERFARVLAERGGRAVSVTCGIHYEAPGKDGLAAIVACTEEILKDLLKELDLE